MNPGVTMTTTEVCALGVPLEWAKCFTCIVFSFLFIIKIIYEFCRHVNNTKGKGKNKSLHSPTRSCPSGVTTIRFGNGSWVSFLLLLWHKYSGTRQLKFIILHSEARSVR